MYAYTRIGVLRHHNLSQKAFLGCSGRGLETESSSCGSLFPLAGRRHPQGRRERGIVHKDDALFRELGFGVRCHMDTRYVLVGAWGDDSRVFDF